MNNILNSVIRCGFIIKTKHKKRTLQKEVFFDWLRELDSNQRPSGYEPDELPLLHPAIFITVLTTLYIISQHFLFVKSFLKSF